MKVNGSVTIKAALVHYVTTATKRNRAKLFLPPLPDGIMVMLPDSPVAGGQHCLMIDPRLSDDQPVEWILGPIHMQENGYVRIEAGNAQSVLAS